MFVAEPSLRMVSQAFYTELLKNIPWDLRLKCSLYNFDRAVRLQGFYHCVIIFLALTVYQKVIRFSLHFKR